MVDLKYLDELLDKATPDELVVIQKMLGEVLEMLDTPMTDDQLKALTPREMIIYRQGFNTGNKE